MFRCERSIAGPLAAVLGVLWSCSAAVAQSPSISSQFRVVCGHDCLEEFAERFLYAITNGDATAVPLAPGVRYTENGQVLAIGDALWATSQGLGANQVVSAIVTFDHRGNLESVPMARGRTVTPNGPFARPFSFLIFESFKVIDGKIRQIEATVHSVPYRMHPGWPAE
jgi:hypothetical protein